MVCVAKKNLSRFSIKFFKRDWFFARTKLSIILIFLETIDKNQIKSIVILKKIL